MHFHVAFAENSFQFTETITTQQYNLNWNIYYSNYFFLFPGFHTIIFCWWCWFYCYYLHRCSNLSSFFCSFPTKLKKKFCNFIYTPFYANISKLRVIFSHFPTTIIKNKLNEWAFSVFWRLFRDNVENKEQEGKNVFYEIESHIFICNFGTEKC